MAALIRSITDRPTRQAGAIGSLDDWVGLWGLDGLPYFLQTTMQKQTEIPDGSFMGLVAGAYLRNSVVFACLAIRARLFGEARFQFQQLRGGRPGNLFGTPELALLERPEPGKTTRDLLQTAILDADLGGNGFLLGRTDAIRRLRPDWTLMAYGSKGRSTELGSWDPDAEVIGYSFHPGGYGMGETPDVFMPEEIAHFAPTKDPLARNRGISLLTAGLREILADNASTTHKLAFFENAATPNLALKFPPAMKKETALEWIELFDQEHRGALNGFRTLFLGSGVEPVPVGLNFQEIDFAKVQGRAETRIATLTGMHPVVVALSEGMQGSSLNAGNFAQAARLVGDATLRPLWGDISGSLETIVQRPPACRLWYDDRDVAFLRQDVTDQAEIIAKQAATITTLTNAGFTPESAVDATVTGDMRQLVPTGLLSVQLQPPGSPLPGATPGATARATTDFWAVDQPWSVRGTIAKGDMLELDDPMVRTFPALFEPVELAIGERARLLLSRGLDVPAIAGQLDRTERHVRRLLAAQRMAANDMETSPISPTTI